MRIVLGCEPERRLVELHGGAEGVQGERAVTGLAEGQARPLGELGSLLPGAAREVESREVVVGDHLGTVFGAVGRERLEPLGRETVLVGAIRARDLAVGDIAATSRWRT